ncbi:MAG TPA: hypothetical protein PKA05_16210 [Roseiflexaceae bacterium]|nr:hypothetical protein [Roseiflexaceae bacterium]HMP41925.1 hypothetical protein [Roseiflexaceae bacterium]
MLADRRTFLVKKGHWNAAIQLLRELKQQAIATGAPPIRAYSSLIGPFDTIAYEFEVDNLATWERELDRWMNEQSAWLVPWFERWTEATEPGGALEIWSVID